MKNSLIEDDIIFRLRKRAEIRRQITTRKSVQENKPDRLSDLLEEAANKIEELEKNQIKIRHFEVESTSSYNEKINDKK